MKIVHICGYSAVGKNHLIKKLRSAALEAPANRTKVQVYLLNRFEVTGNVAFPELIKPDSGRVLDNLKDDLISIIEQGNYETIVHRWQYKSATITQFIKNNYPEIEQSTYIIWLDPIQHLNNARTFRSDNFIEDWTEAHLKINFIDCFR